MGTRKYLGDLDDLFVSQGELEARTGITSRDLVALQIKREDSGYPMYKLVTALFGQYKEVRKLTGKPLSDDGDSDLAKLTIEHKKEDVLSRQIKNQLLLGDLILKAEAQKRMLNLLKTYQDMVEKFLSEASALPLPEDPRERLEVMTKLFNTLLDRIRENGLEIISWQRDGQSRLLATRLLDMANKDEQEKEVADFLDAFVPPTEEEFLS